MTAPAKQSGPDAQRQLASLPLAIVLLSPGTAHRIGQSAAEQFLGQSSRLLSGRNLGDVLTFAEARLAERVADAESPVSAREVNVIVAGLGPRRIDVTLTPIVDDARAGNCCRCMIRARPKRWVTIRARGDDPILRGPEILAHEIKNPLAGIRGAAQLLGRKLDGKDRALTDLIAGEVDRIATLIDQMQTLSRRTAAPVEPCNLHEAVRRAIAVIDAPTASKARASRRNSIPRCRSVLGSPDGLVQVLINLLANAREACRDQVKPRIVVRTRFASGLQLHSSTAGRPVRLPVELRVSDNGPGVDPAMRDHIFDPFVTTKKTGQGLGLPLVRKLVRDMNGRITHERDEAKGWTHFRVHLPLATEPRTRRKDGASKDGASKDGAPKDGAAREGIAAS
jgi:two-component system nitrogen regulation sensor histidine kinase GlnL